MLCRVPADAVHARVFEGVDIADDLVLHSGILGFKVGHADVLVGQVVAVVVVGAGSFVVEVVGVAHIGLDGGRPCAALAACKMVGDDVHDDLDAVLVRLGAERLQIVQGADLVAECEARRLVQPVPRAVAVMLLQGRGLDRRKARLCDVGQFFLDLIERPVEAVQDVAVLDPRGKSVIRRGGDLTQEFLIRGGSGEAGHGQAGQQHTDHQRQT